MGTQVAWAVACVGHHSCRGSGHGTVPEVLEKRERLCSSTLCRASAPTAASLLGGLECFTREVLPRAVLTVVGCVWQETKFWFCFF